MSATTTAPGQVGARLPRRGRPAWQPVPAPLPPCTLLMVTRVEAALARARSTLAAAGGDR